MLCNFVNRYLNNWENSREIVQNTFVKIWQNKDKIEIKTTVKSYLFQASKNNMIDFIRKSKKEVELSEGIISTIEVNNVSETHLDSTIIKSAILKGLKTLKPKNRQIFELNKLEGLTYKEIADHLDISERAVEDNMSRAFKKLKLYIEEHENLY